MPILFIKQDKKIFHQYIVGRTPAGHFLLNKKTSLKYRPSTFWGLSFWRQLSKPGTSSFRLVYGQNLWNLWHGSWIHWMQTEKIIEAWYMIVLRLAFLDKLASTVICYHFSNLSGQVTLGYVLAGGLEVVKEVDRKLIMGAKRKWWWAEWWGRFSGCNNRWNNIPQVWLSHAPMQLLAIT